MRHILILILVFMVLAAENAVGSPLASSYARATGFSQVASPHFLAGSVNPAAYANASGIALGAYLTPAEISTSREDGTVTGLTGIFAAVPIGSFGFFGEGIGSYGNSWYSSDRTLSWTGGGAGAGYRWNDRLNIGLYFGGRSPNAGNLNYSASAGVQYSFFHEQRFGAGFGLFQPVMGLMMQGEDLSAGKRPDLRLSPSVAMDFFRLSFLTVQYQNSLRFRGQFQRADFQSGLQAEILRLVTLQAGIVGPDFLKNKYHYFGFGLKIPLYHLDFNVFSSYADVSPDFRSALTDKIAFGGYFEYRLADSKVEKSKLISELVPADYFTPDGDGIQDFVTVHLAHEELLSLKDWMLVIRNERNEIITSVRPNVLDQAPRGSSIPFPNSIVWTGLDYQGRRSPEGRYSLQFIAVTPDGRLNKWQVGSIFLDLHRPDFRLSGLNSSYFLGNGKTIRFQIEDDNLAFRVFSAELVNFSGKKISAGRVSSRGKITGFEWDGMTAEKTVIATGEYSLEVSGETDDRGTVMKVAGRIKIYGSAERLALELSETAFSPDGDGVRDVLKIKPILREVPEKTGWRILATSIGEGRAVKIWSGKTPAGEISWADSSAPEGQYAFVLQLVQEDGGIEESMSSTVILDKTAPEITLSSDQTDFTPDGDGRSDRIRFQFEIRDSSEIRERLILIQKKDRIIRRAALGGGQNGIFLWDGVTDDGFVIGSFEELTAVLEAVDAAGNRGKSASLAFKTGLVANSFSSDESFDKKETKLKLQSLAFQPGSTLPTAASMRILEKMAEYIIDNEDIDVLITGHTDQKGGFDYNQKLSQDRADTIRNLLIEKGVPKDRIKAVGLGYSKPLAEEVDDDTRAQNRRVEFTFSRKGRRKTP